MTIPVAVVEREETGKSGGKKRDRQKSEEKEWHPERSERFPPKKDDDISERTAYQRLPHQFTMKPQSLPEWLTANEKDFHPPVCNKCMYSDQLKLFFVGGPNSRKDFHLEEGDEFFYQLKGDMVLRVVEKGEMKDVRIKEGEVFLLPSRVEHSPQRFENTLGVVLERERLRTEFDCVRYFVDGTTTRLYERWFHLDDVVKDLPPVIKKYLSSVQCARQEVSEDSFLVHPPFEPTPLSLPAPINLNQFIQDNNNRLMGGPVTLYGDGKQGSSVILYSTGEYTLETGAEEMVLWMENGYGSYTVEGYTYQLHTRTTAKVSPKKKLTVTVSDGVLMTLQMFLPKFS